ncbi:MAG: hypothetical protein A2075_23775 [Geobacteraceae bacterium GWC2_58_44]|nr:MAG: hypothetical protein A2075_23775 [Geobacteraceae bacterium GWC2_58_44]HBG07195.1 hypothetical protein [Geobacter sp.]
MEEALQPLEADQHTRSTRNFALGIAASVILHLICTVLLFGLPEGSPARQSVTYVDLSTPQQRPAPMPAPLKEANPEQAAPEPVAAEPETPPVPETPAAPESPPQPTAALQEQPPATPETEVAEQLSHTTLGLGLTKGYFQSLGSGETLREGIKDYYLEMLEGINEKWWLDPKLNRLSTLVVNIIIARNGDIVDSQIVASSGDRRYDRAVVAALTAAGPLPPLPASYQGEFFLAPIRLVPPLNLMAW